MRAVKSPWRMCDCPQCTAKNAMIIEAIAFMAVIIEHVAATAPKRDRKVCEKFRDYCENAVNSAIPNGEVARVIASIDPNYQCGNDTKH